MSRRFLTFAAILVCGGVWLAWYLQTRVDSERIFEPWTAKELKDFAAKAGRTNGPAETMLAPIELSKPIRLAVGGLGLADKRQNEQLGDLVTADLSSTPGYDLVERQLLAAVLQEINLNWSGFVRANDAVRAGKLLNADWFLLGTETQLNGHHSLVVRVVDARTGILRDAAVFRGDKPLTVLAADVAGFLRESRQNAASAKTRRYLAIGSFEDLGVNNRMAGFPAELRGWLTAAYQGTQFTLLERDDVQTLLQEVQLDLAGLTDASGTNPPAAMQSAFWVVDGQYQSYETTRRQVELKLNVERIFGTTRQFTLRGDPGDPVCRQIKQEIDDAINQSPESVTPTRMNEARTEMYVGKDLTGIDPSRLFLPWNTLDLDPQAAARVRRNVGEAIKAFQSVLLLDPGNREAKIYLAACYLNQTIDRPDEARDGYREVLNEPVQDKWFTIAQQALDTTFTLESPEVKLQWFEDAAQHATNPQALNYFRNTVEVTRQKVAARGVGAESQAAAGAELFKQITNSALSGNWSFAGAGDYVKTFGTNRAAAAARLAELYPVWKTQAPELEPYLLATVVTAQLDTNAPIITKFQQLLEQYAAHPEQVFQPDRYWQQIWQPVYQWSYEHGRFDLAMLVLKGKTNAATAYPKSPFRVPSDDSKLALAFADFRLERWRDALDIFESYSNRPVRLNSSGPWGNMFATFLPDQWANRCREKLGLPVPVSPLEFDLGKPVIALCAPATFTTDESGVWVAIAGQLLHLDLDLKTNLVVNLPMDDPVPVTALCQNSSSLWMATEGAGMIEFDKASHTSRRFTTKDGLMLDLIASMQLAGDTLWIGYGDRRAATYGDVPAGGGLGSLDLTTLKFTSYTRSIADGTDTLKFRDGNRVLESSDKPTARAIHALAAAPNGVVWFATPFHPLREYRTADNIWQGIPEVRETTCLAIGGNRVFSGQSHNWWAADIGRTLGVSVLNLKNGQWHELNRIDEIPPATVTAIAPDGNDLWVGGFGYLARVDLAQEKVRKFAHIYAAGVDHIEVGGGYVWAQFNWSLYRASLGQIE